MTIREYLAAQGIDQKTIDLFMHWHKENPQIWIEFERLALTALSKGVNHWGAKGIAEVVRWNLKINSPTKEDFKFNNNFHAYYARVFAWKHPNHSNFFELRTVRGLTTTIKKSDLGIPTKQL